MAANLWAYLTFGRRVEAVFGRRVEVVVDRVVVKILSPKFFCFQQLAKMQATEVASK